MNRFAYYLLSLIFLGGVVALNLAVLLEPSRLDELINEEIKRNLKAHYEYDDKIAIEGGAVVVKNLILSDPDDPERIALTCRRVGVHLNWRSLLAGNLEVRKVAIEEPIVYLTWNDQGTLELPSLITSSDTKSRAPTIPALEIRSLGFRFINAPFFDADRKVGLDRVDLEINPRFSDAFSYAFSGRVQDDTFGTIDLDGNFGTALLRSTVECRGFRITPKLASLFRDDIRAALEPISMEGGLDLRLEVSSEDYLEGVDLELEAETKGLDLGWGEGRPVIEDLVGRFVFEGRRFESRHLRFELRDAPVEVKELRVDLADEEGVEPTFFLQALVSQLDVDPEFCRSLKELPEPFPSVGETMLAFGVDGPLTLDCVVTRDPESQLDPETRRFEVDCLVHFEETTLAWCGYEEDDGTREGYPYPITKLTGQMRIVNDGVRTEGLRSSADDQDAVITGFVDFGRKPLAYEVKLDARELSLDERVRSALSEEEQAIYDSFAPEGAMDVNMTVSRRPDDPGEGATVALAFGLQLEEARPAVFPVLMENVEGHVILNSGEPVRLVGIEADALGGRVQLDGEVSYEGELDDPREVFELVVEAEKLAFGDDMLSALEQPLPKVAAELRRYSPSGRIDLTAKLFEGRPEPNEIDFDLDGVDFRFPEFPEEPIRDLKGKFSYRGDRVRVSEASFTALENRFEPSGWLDLGAEPRWDLKVKSRALKLNDRVAVFAGRLASDFAEIRKDLDFSGSVDLDVSLRRSSVGELITTELLPQKVVVSHRRKPWAIRDLSGQLRFRNDKLRADDLTANFVAGRGPAPTPVILRLRQVNFDRQSGWHLEGLGLRSLAIGESTKSWAPEGVVELIDEYALAGFIDADLSILRLHNGRAVFEGKLTPKNFRADVGLPLEFDQLTLEVDSGVVDEEGLSFLEGELKRGVGRLQKFDFENFSAQARFEEKTLDLTSIKARLVGGTTRPNATRFRVSMREGAPFDFALTLIEADLSRLVRTFGGEAKRLQGRANLVAGLSGRFDDLQSYRGEARAKMRGDKLYELPFFAAVFQLINFDFLTTPRRGSQRGEIRARIEDQKVAIEKADFRGPGINLDGSGTVGFDGLCRLEFEPKAIKLLDSIPVIGEISDLVGGFIVDKVYVSGPIENPRASVGNYITDILPSEPDSGRRPLVRPPRKEPRPSGGSKESPSKKSPKRNPRGSGS